MAMTTWESDELDRVIVAWREESVLVTGNRADTFSMAQALTSLSGWVSIVRGDERPDPTTWLSKTALRERIIEQVNRASEGRVRFDGHTKRMVGAALQ